MPIPANWSSKLLSVMRIAVALGFLHHGTSKILGLPPFPYPMNPMSTAAGWIELVGGGLLVIGLFTRPVAFLASGMCAIGYFLAHAPKGLYPSVNGGEPIYLYCFVFLFLAASGGGAWSADAARGKA